MTVTIRLLRAFFSRKISKKKKLTVSRTDDFSPHSLVFRLDFRQCFQLFAPQGFVDTPDKLCFIMRSLSMAPTITELKRYFNKYKKDAGVVEFDDFLKIVLEHRSVEDAPKEILAAFQHYDTQRMGFIDSKQLRYILTHTGEKLTDRDGKNPTDTSNVFLSSCFQSI